MSCDEHLVPNAGETWSPEDFWDYLQTLLDGAHSVEVIPRDDGQYIFRVWNEDHGLSCD